MDARKESSRLSLAQMEKEMDRCPAPWACEQGCYEARRGCLRNARRRDRQ